MNSSESGVRESFRELVREVEEALESSGEEGSGTQRARRLVVDLVVRYPSSIHYSWKTNLKPKVEYLKREMGLSIMEVLEYPPFLGYSLDGRIRPRHVALVRMGYAVVAREMSSRMSVGDRKDDSIEAGIQRSKLGSVPGNVEGVEGTVWGAEEGKSGPLFGVVGGNDETGERVGMERQLLDLEVSKKRVGLHQFLHFTDKKFEERFGLFLWVAVSPAVAEELLFRGLLLTGLQERLGRIDAAMLSAALFALFHLFLSILFPSIALGIAAACLLVRMGYGCVGDRKDLDRIKSNPIYPARYASFQLRSQDQNFEAPQNKVSFHDRSFVAWSAAAASSRRVDTEASEEETVISGSKLLTKSKPLVAVQAEFETRTVKDEERGDGRGGQRRIRKMEGGEKGGGDGRVERVVAGNGVGKRERGCKEEEEAVAVIAGVLRDRFGPQIVREEVEDWGSDEKVKEEEGWEGDDQEVEKEEDEEDAEAEASPSILNLSKETLLAKLQFFVELVGEEAAGRMVRSYPSVLQLSKKNLQNKVAVLADLIGRENAVRGVARFPTLMSASEDGIRESFSKLVREVEEALEGSGEVGNGTQRLGVVDGDTCLDGKDDCRALDSAPSVKRCRAHQLVVDLVVRHPQSVFCSWKTNLKLKVEYLKRDMGLSIMEQQLRGLAGGEAGWIDAAMLSAALFPLFHLSLSLLFPNMALGIAAGLIVVHSNNVLPAIPLHTTYQMHLPCYHSWLARKS
ncbi:unnamed protein product [Closterium sp. Yama58-4]|nr:unnamed protein product [Closterium sp. Yama58-4]